MDRAMAQDKNTLDAREDDSRSEPALPLSFQGSSSASSSDSAGEPSFMPPPPIQLLPPPLPGSAAPRTDFIPPSAPPQQVTPPLPAEEQSLLEQPASSDDDDDEGFEPGTGAPRRRMARRRPAGPSRNRIAANDDGPSIGGLIFALQQKPSNALFKFAAIASGI